MAWSKRAAPTTTALDPAPQCGFSRRSRAYRVPIRLFRMTSVLCADS
jgi:hypothetical protein